jgi:putative mRNA 3-end processing factor
MTVLDVDVTGKGAVLLGNKITCDGFVHDVPYRVQTHIHDDHMGEFERSKGFQNIFMSAPTRELLIAELNFDLEYRSNIIPVPSKVPYHVDDIAIELISNGHMLGSMQAAVTLPSGMRVGYSGDFQWPLEDVIQVEALVVDSTYGDPDSHRAFSQEDLHYALVDLALRKVKEGPIFLKAHRGVLQQALDLLADPLSVPIVVSRRVLKEAAVYQRYGYSVGNLLDTDSPEGREALSSDRYIRLYSKGDGTPDDPTSGTIITLNACLPDTHEPIYEFSERSYRVAMSGHADFEGTLAYVKATGATYVVADNSRGGSAHELATALRTQLGIMARASSREVSLSWGT